MTWAAHGLDLVHKPVWEYNWLQKLDIMPKLKIFLWQLCHSSLPTRGTLSDRGLRVDPACPFCHSEVEDMDHLFLHCTIAQGCWNLAISHNWINANLVFSPQLTVLQMLSTTCNARPNVHMDRIISLLWSIWKIRNGAVFRNTSPNPGLTLIRAKQANVERRIRHKFTHQFQPTHQKLSASTRI